MSEDPLSPEVVADRVVGKRRGGLRTKIGSAIAAVLVVLGKLKTVLLLLFKFKLIFTLLSTLVSMFLYGLAFGWPFGIGFVIMLAIHEFGHYIAIRREGMHAGLPVFIPFFGASITLRQQPLNAWQEFKIAAAGPLFGAAAGVAALLIGTFAVPSGSAGMYLSLAYTGFFLQLFNLIPVAPLDGGRIVAAISPALWWIGLPILIAAAFFFRSILAAIIAVFVLIQLIGRWRSRKAETEAGYYRVTALQRVVAASTWLVLVLVCIAGMGMVGAV